MATTTISVPEIHCGHCKESIEGALGGLAGVQRAEVSIDDRNVTVDFDDAAVDEPALRAAIEAQGYEVAAP